MTDILLEIIRTGILLVLLIFLWRAGRKRAELSRKGWRLIIGAFCLLLFGSALDITDNFEVLNRYIVVGDTQCQALLEKIVGYLGGFMLLTVGLLRWLPTVTGVEEKEAVLRDLAKTNEALDRLNRELEQRVDERTNLLQTELRDRKRAEEARKESERRFRAIFDQTYQFIGLMTPDGTLIEANRPALESYGLEDSDVLNRPFWETPWWTHSSEQQDRLRDAIARSAAGEFVRFEAWHPAPDGSIHHVDCSIKPVKDETGHVYLLIPEGRDITERKRAEELLLTEKLLSDDYINSLPGLFYVFDEQRFVRWNSEWEKVTGYNAEELGARYGTDFFEGKDQMFIEEQMREVFREGASDAEAELVTKDGRRIPYYFTGLRKVFDGKDHLVGLGIDITDRKRIEQEREELIDKLEAQNAELERFTYTVSHDLKSPLTTIMGYLGILRQDLDEGDSGPVEDDLAHISSAADKMQELLRDLLEMSRIGRLFNPPEDVPLGELVGEALELVGGQVKENRVKVEVSPDLPLVFGDRLRLREVLQNLIDNAVKYMGDQPQPRVEIGSRRDGGETVCYVRDNGIGIDPRYHDKIFGLFDQLDQKVEGSGIGLALVKRIVEVHKGRIWVESEGSGQGSTFCFTIPARSESQEVAPSKSGGRRGSSDTPGT